MLYQNVAIESFGYVLPAEVLSSESLEQRLAPLYRRLKLPEGRLELMTGIRARRLWPVGTMPSEKSIESADRAVRAAQFDRSQIGVLIHASVCRDHLEPATACRVHHHLGLPAECQIFDLSNACLGLLNGVVQVANMIELGQVRAGLVVGTEDSRPLLENTIAELNGNESLRRADLKLAVASLTIGSGSCAILLTDRELSQTGNRLVSATARANTRFHELCHNGRDEAGPGMRPFMDTDSEQLMREGIATGIDTFDQFLRDASWKREMLEHTFCHQVGAAHRKLMLESLGLSVERDFATLEWLGNTGSVALPLTAAIGLGTRKVAPGSRVALLGIGSGINCLMLGALWERTLVLGDGEASPWNPAASLPETVPPVSLAAATES